MSSTIEENFWLEKTQHIRESLHVMQHLPTEMRHVILERDYPKWVAETPHNEWKCLGLLPPIYPEWLGSQAFLSAYQIRYPYIVGEMANGIATATMVVAAVKAGMMGFFGAAGLLPSVIEDNIVKIKSQVSSATPGWGSNLIHSPNEPSLEAAAIDIYLKHGVKNVSASAYMSLNMNIVYYACKGLRQDREGNIIRQNRVIAKISRPEVAQLFMQPAPHDILTALLNDGKLTQIEVDLANHIPLAESITVESDSGGHTDNRPLGSLFPRIYDLSERIREKYQYANAFHLGAAGGLGTPLSVASAFALGASYVLTGSINQSAVESGLSEEGRAMLAGADIADMMMAPAADMFELGVKLQVLKRGTFFGPRATKLYEIYTKYNSLDEIPAIEKEKCEQQIFGKSVEEIWDITKAFFAEREPTHLIRAEQDPKFKMALVFRWYLGLSSRWAITGESSRKMDYQIWSGPAMGSFNAWVKGTFLEPIQSRTVAEIGLNLLEGAAMVMRAQQLRSFGFVMPSCVFNPAPKRMMSDISIVNSD